MPIPILTNLNNENEYDYSESDSESKLDSDNDEYFIRFNSTTNYDHVEYIMICSTCYERPYDTILSNQDSEEEHECLGCQHDVLVYFINGCVDQQMMSTTEINNLCRLQGINIFNHNIFEHLQQSFN